MSKESKGRPFDETYFLRALAICILAWLGYRVFQYLLHFYQLHSAQVKLAFPAGLILSLFPFIALIHNRLIDRKENRETEEKRVKIVVGTSTKSKRPVYIEEKARLYHTQVIGSTGAGKTDGIILPWIFNDIEKGRGILIIDGKPEDETLSTLYGKIVKEGREDDFRLFSLNHPELSHSFNPFSYGASEQIAERIFSSFQTSSDHYKSVQYSATGAVIGLIQSLGVIPTAGLIRELLRNQDRLKEWCSKIKDPLIFTDIDKLVSLPSIQFQNDFSGILAYLETFIRGTCAQSINQKVSDIHFEKALTEKHIIYFQLPTLKAPTLASNIGRLALQSFAAAAGDRQAKLTTEPEQMFSLYLDDFNDYMYPGFASISNKVRSAGIGMTFAHQSLGDLNKVSPDFKDILIENTNNKIVLKINDPDSAEFFSSYIGTQSTEKVTERQSRGLFGAEKTGEQSVRNTEEFIVHPNVFKSDFGPGDAIAILTNLNGPRSVERIRCNRVTIDFPRLLPPTVQHPKMTFLEESIQFIVKEENKVESTESSQPTESSSTYSISSHIKKIESESEKKKV